MAREDWDWERVTGSNPHDGQSWDDVSITTRCHGLIRGRVTNVPVAELDDFIAWLQEIRDEVRKGAA